MTKFPDDIWKKIKEFLFDQEQLKMFISVMKSKKSLIRLSKCLQFEVNYARNGIIYHKGYTHIIPIKQEIEMYNRMIIRYFREGRF